MSTNAKIGLQKKGNKYIRAIYNHYDGYPKYLGSILLNNYDTEEKVEELIDLGNASFIKETVETSKFYGRDMKRKNNIETELYSNENDFISESGIYEYLYLFKNGEWHICSIQNSEFIKLTNEIIDANKIINNSF